MGDATDSGKPKSIVLFSDGTGNGSGKLFKTNVWRLYEATDLGPNPEQGERLQVGYYDNGIGSQAFKPLAILTGIFGIGLKRNVLTLYRYACRNHNRTQGDSIYAFGFSRGAFTIRVVIALIASQGLVEYEDERELLRKSAQAYRQMRREAWPRAKIAQGVYWVARQIGGTLDTVWQRTFGIEPYKSDDNFKPTIEYVGLWDTVSAYGGPIAELTRAIDNWIFPLSMPNYALAKEVQSARHALSIDDERDSFHPLLWDEVAEKRLVDAEEVPAGRIQQVWFAGMHADVGGGYPDESLSYVSLAWIIEGAIERNLRLHEDARQRIHDMQNSYGPIHNSRSGTAAYYRYQPRRIAAWLHPVDPATYILRDPAIVETEDGPDKGKQRGLLLKCHVHESVIARVHSGTDDYAPITLPASFDIVPPLPPGKNIAPMVSAAVRKRLANPAVATARAERQATLFDEVWKRRVLYFSTVLATTLLMAMPVLPLDYFRFSMLKWIGVMIGALADVLPGFTRPWIDAWSSNPLAALLLILAILVLLGRSNAVELQLRDGTRRLWREAFGEEAVDRRQEGVKKPPLRLNSPLRRVRESKTYQFGLQTFKWKVLPNVLGPIILIVGALVGLALISQTTSAIKDSAGSFCQDKIGRPLPTHAFTVGDTTYVDFKAADACTPTGVTVKKGRHYAINFTVVDKWKDGKRRRSRCLARWPPADAGGIRHAMAATYPAQPAMVCGLDRHVVAAHRRGAVAPAACCGPIDRTDQRVSAASLSRSARRETRSGFGQRVYGGVRGAR
ncbi:DUF2235 domain-containing protein [Sphingomonas bacterium]|uniref:DUF2235 domain-containing protein n=1 Tax=Sphingomonas bacterium TaxID=1895847 RepID=UPI0026265EAE|nr:DUF2235 domain-containing protein [Sphingomonas bacterium]MDB5677116.1 hypothetical protein [Sphingomonas bacterium]